jgi:hypothetical protein
VSGLAPPELRELIGLLAELTEMLPIPADGNWKRHDEVQLGRQSLLTSRLQMLARELADLGKYPAAGEEMLIMFCERSARVIGAELAKPLGYEPKADAAAGQPA